LFAPPRWLRSLGRSAWLIAGIALVTVATVWLLALFLALTALIPRRRPGAAVAARLRRRARDPPAGLLIVTIAGGSLFGAAGLILAAPLTSAATRIAADLAAARARPEPGTADAGGPLLENATN
jgi:hypothetical protein